MPAGTRGLVLSVQTFGRGGAEIGIGGVVPIAVRATLGGAYERGRRGAAVEPARVVLDSCATLAE